MCNQQQRLYPPAALEVIRNQQQRLYPPAAFVINSSACTYIQLGFVHQ